MTSHFVRSITRCIIPGASISRCQPIQYKGDHHMALSPSNLKCEYKVNPIGIDTPRPRLSWQIQSPARGVTQTAYQVHVTGDDGAVLWDSGRVDSDQSIHVSYGGPALVSGQRCAWQVRAWVDGAQVSAWSEAATWEMGLLQADDWQAQWIAPDIEEDINKSNPCPILRKEFIVDGEIRAARLYVTAHGLYEAELNGQRVGNQVLTPGWTVYDERLQYQVYDVGEQLAVGENAIGVTLGDGWFRGNLGFSGQRNVYGETLALLLQLKVEYAGGRIEWVAVSDETWKASTGPILSSDIYNGERYDARLERPGWSHVGYDDGDWKGVKVAEHSKKVLCAPAGPPISRIEEISPVEIIRTPEGDTVLDMGQNMVGWVRLRVKGDAGTTVTLRHAEVLDKDGNFYITNLRSAEQTNSYTLKGGGVEVYEPRFTFQGFRYVVVDGYPGKLTLDSLTGVVVHSDITPIGSWESDNGLLNQLQHNIVWGQKGNFVDVPTDCPQRDERLGWT
ncbi:MAG: family 78 glycoside hydrolase catalytic domain, partial [Anaerolineae bacterium]|nr:family 78 glycoside hydrolase catalytic domain [Anaerolineae bacterium]